MTEHLTMNTIIHAAFRRDLARFHEALTSFPSGSRSRAERLMVAWDNLAHQLHRHHIDEETIFFPAFGELGVDQTLIGNLDTEHSAMAAALDNATAAMQALSANPSTASAAAAREAVDELDAVMRTHLAHEERDLEPFAAQHAGTRTLKRAQSEVRTAHKGGVGTFAAWLMDGADPDTTAALRKEIPPPVLFVLNRFAGRSYRREIATTWT